MKDLVICEHCDDVKLKGHKCHAINLHSSMKTRDFGIEMEEDDRIEATHQLFASYSEYRNARA